MAGLRNPDQLGRVREANYLTLSRRKLQESALSLPAGRCYCPLCVRGVPACRHDRRMKNIESTTALHTEGSMTIATQPGKLLSRLSFGAMAGGRLRAFGAGARPGGGEKHG